MYENTTASIRGSTAKFDVLIGCRQGGQESPCIFNYYFDYVLKVAAHEIDRMYPDGWGIEFEYNIPHWCTNREQRSNHRMNGVEIIRWILYADDVVLFCKSVQEAENLVNIINNTCKRFGLNISFKKTKTQVFMDEDLAKKESLLKIGEEVIDNVQQFTYLGQVITNDVSVCFTEHRTDRAWAKFNELRTVLTDNKVNMQTRRKLLESCVRSRLIYGTQACYPKEHQMKKLEACWYGCMRSMVKGGWRRKHVPKKKKKKDVDEEEDVDYSFVYSNEQVRKIVGSQDIKDHVNAQYLKYIGHVCRAENNEITKIMLFAKAKRAYYRDPWIKIARILGVDQNQAKRATQSRKEFAELVRKSTNKSP